MQTQSIQLTPLDQLTLSERGHRLHIMRANGDRSLVAIPSTFRATGKTIYFTNAAGRVVTTIHFPTRTCAVNLAKLVTASVKFGVRIEMDREL